MAPAKGHQHPYKANIEVTILNIWRPPETAPKDGTEILLRLPEGLVSAWFCDEPPTNDAKDDGCYDWICFDDMFQIDGHDNQILGWMPMPEE